MSTNNPVCTTELMLGNGSTTSWPFEFFVEEKAHLTVYLYSAASGTYTVVDPTTFDVTGLANEDGGTVTYPVSGSAISSSAGIVIHRNRPYAQEQGFRQQGAWNPFTLEETLDNIVYEIQQNRRDINRAVLGQPSVTTPFSLLSLQPGQYLVMGENGQIVGASGPSGGGGGSGIRTFTFRNELVEAVDDGYVASQNELISAGGLMYIGSTGATSIQDLPGIIPYGNTASPRHFGAVGDGSANDAEAIAFARDYCADTATTLFIDRYFRYVGELEFFDSIIVSGVGMDECGIYVETDNAHYGGRIVGSNSIFSDFEMKVSIPSTIVNGGGHLGCCFTIGDAFTPANDPEPAATKNIIFNRMKFSRGGNGAGMAIAITARSRFSFFNECVWEGGLGTGVHASAILCHWGAWSDGITTEIAAIPLRQAKFLPGHYSFHPNNIYVRGGQCTRTARFLTFSSSYDVLIEGLVFDGTGFTGGSLCNITTGDEAQTFAHPEDYGHVYTNIAFRNITVKQMTGSGSAVQVVDINGAATSKQLTSDLANYDDSSYDTTRYGGQTYPRFRQTEFNNVLFENITFDGGPLIPPAASAEVTEFINLFRLRGNVTFRNIRGLQTEDNNAHCQMIEMEDCDGTFVFDNVHVDGVFVLDNLKGVSVRDCYIKAPKYPILRVTVDSTSLFYRGLSVFGETSNIRGDIVSVASSTALDIQLTNQWNHFTVGETMTASNGETCVVDAATQTTVSNALITINGVSAAAILGQDLAKHDTILELAAAIPFSGQVTNYTVGQILTGSRSGASGPILSVTDAGATGTVYVGEITNGPFWEDEPIIDALGGDGVVASDGGIIHAFRMDYTGETGGGFTGVGSSTITGATSGATAPLLGLRDLGTTGFIVVGTVTGGPFQNGEDLRISGTKRGVANIPSGVSDILGLRYTSEDSTFVVGRQIRGSFSDAVSAATTALTDNGSTGILWFPSMASGTFEHSEWLGDGVAGGGVAVSNCPVIGAAFDRALMKGDIIKYSGGELVVGEYIPVGVTLSIPIEPARVAASAGATLTLERFTENFSIRNSRLDGANRAILASNCRKLVAKENNISNSGQYSIVFDVNAKGDVLANYFHNTGWRRLVPGSDATTVTRNILVSAGCTMRLKDNRFGGAALTSRHIEFQVGANGGVIRDNEIEESALSNDILVTNPQTGGGWAVVDNNRDATGLLISSGTRIGSKTFDPGSIASGAQEITTVTVTGASLVDFAQASFSLSLAGLGLDAYVSAADTVTCRFTNLSGGAVDLASGTLTAFAIRR